MDIGFIVDEFGAIEEEQTTYTVKQESKSSKKRIGQRMRQKLVAKESKGKAKGKAKGDATSKGFSKGKGKGKSKRGSYREVAKTKEEEVQDVKAGESEPSIEFLQKRFEALSTPSGSKERISEQEHKEKRPVSRAPTPERKTFSGVLGDNFSAPFFKILDEMKDKSEAGGIQAQDFAKWGSEMLALASKAALVQDV